MGAGCDEQLQGLAIVPESPTLEQAHFLLLELSLSITYHYTNNTFTPPHCLQAGCPKTITHHPGILLRVPLLADRPTLPLLSSWDLDCTPDHTNKPVPWRQPQVVQLSYTTLYPNFSDQGKKKPPYILILRGGQQNIIYKTCILIAGSQLYHI